MGEVSRRMEVLRSQKWLENRTLQSGDAKSSFMFRIFVGEFVCAATLDVFFIAS
jgi:hypothetical protein